MSTQDTPSRSVPNAQQSSEVKKQNPLQVLLRDRDKVWVSTASVDGWLSAIMWLTLITGAVLAPVATAFLGNGLLSLIILSITVGSALNIFIVRAILRALILIGDDIHAIRLQKEKRQD